MNKWFISHETYDLINYKVGTIWLSGYITSFIFENIYYLFFVKQCDKSFTKYFNRVVYHPLIWPINIIGTIKGAKWTVYQLGDENDKNVVWRITSRK